MVFKKRSVGVLLPVFSLPGKYGIGSFGKEAYKFIDFLKDANQGYWQVLPQGSTSYGDSPYQSFSTFAGNPYFINLETLIKTGLLTKEECDACDFGDVATDINYKALYDNRFILLKKAYQIDQIRYSQQYKEFEDKNAYWLEDYATFMAIKDANGGISWLEWDAQIKNREPKALEQAREQLKEEISFYKYLQFQFFAQWLALKRYANSNGIEIIGDIPIYVSIDSADVWANIQLFDLNDNREPNAVAGCPPDAFTASGQLWGNPLYNWQQHEATGFEWWIKRIRESFYMYDVVRIDHFRGFDEYYVIPFKDKTAENGTWQKAPGVKLFEAIKAQLGEVKIIAEDLGHITDTVRELLAKTNYPGMKVMQFGFSKGYESDYLLHRHIKNSVVYTGTHDNNTSKGWYESLNDADKEYSASFMGFRTTDNCWDKDKFLRHTLSSSANLVIVPLQDYMGLGEDARINIPSTIGQNWRWRIEKLEQLEHLSDYMAKLAKLYYRI